MDRRNFLAGTTGAAALLAGCSTGFATDDDEDGDDANPNGSAEESNDGGNPTLPDGPEASPTVVDFKTASLTATVADDHVSTADRLRVSLDFVEPATPDGPARLAAAVYNGKSFEQTFRLRRTLVFDDPARARNDDRDSIYLVPTEATPPAETVPDLTRDEKGRWRVASLRDEWYPKTWTLGPDEELTAELALAAHPDEGNSPIVPGRYEFARRGNAVAIAVWPTDEPGPDGDSGFADADPPTLPNEDGEMAWYHQAGPGTETYLEPSAEAIEAPGTIEFAFVNRSREAASGNPGYWRLYKLLDDEWYPVAPWEWVQPLEHVGPGSVRERRLHCYHGDPIETTEARTVGHLGGGRYAFAVGYAVADETHAAMFDLEAPELSVGAEEDATVADEGDRIVVELPNYEGARRPATFTATRTDEAGERLLPEQLPRRPQRAFRNSLALFEPGVERVEVKTDRGTALRPFGYEENETRPVEYRGEAFEVTGVLEPDD